MGKNKIFCHACGEENPGNAKFCISCGAKIGEPEPTSHAASKEEAGNKQMQPSSILLLALGFALIGIVILFVAGTFDGAPEISNGQSSVSSQTPGTNNQSPGVNADNPHAGADMEKLKQITELEKAVEENPDDHQSLVKLAHLLNDTGFYSKAINKYIEFLKIHPDDADVRVDMGVCYFQLKDFDNAIAAMKEALKYQPKHQIAHFNIGIVYFNAGDVKQAKKWWNKAVALDPNTDIAKKAKELIDNN